MARAKKTGVTITADGTIQIEFIYREERCRERVKLEPTAANLNKAQAHRQSILDAIDTGTFNYRETFPDSKRAKKFEESSDLKVGKWLATWLEKNENHFKASTFNDYTKTVNILKKAFGALPLHELKKKHVKAWCAKQTCTNKRIANLLSPLRTALQEAVVEELIDVNPLIDFRFTRNEPPKPKTVDPFSKKEQAAILDNLIPQYRNLIQFAFWSGLRTSELVALEWKAIDFDRNIVSVHQAKTEKATKPEKTKTRAGTRFVKLLPAALQALKNQKQYSLLEGSRIFLNPKTGKPYIGDRQIRRFWELALVAANVRYRKPYQTRHTYGSMMLSAGEPLAWVSNQMGHSSVTQTDSTYAIWIPDALPEAGNKAVELFGDNE
jgi:integrase